MEIDELEKRVSWLDSERQKDKKIIAELSDLIISIKEDIMKEKGKFSALEMELKAAKNAVSRVDKVDADFADYKTSVLKQITDVEKRINSGEAKLDKANRSSYEALNKKIMEIQNELKPITELKKSSQLRSEEITKVNQKIDEYTKTLAELHSADAEIQRQQRSLINDLTLETKRLSEIQLEASSIRKRIEEDRGVTELHKEHIRKLESRINDLQTSEIERKQNQASFIEKQNLLQVEKEKTWKDWQKRFADLEGLGNEFNAQLLELKETHRSVKNSQQEFEEINERFNRRINEITEMNRLAEERFRQEWVGFKADDQKRWTNYTLTREEEQRGDERQVNNILERLVVLEDVAQDIKDTLHLVKEETQKQMRGFLAVTQDLLDSYEQSIGKRVRS